MAAPAAGDVFIGDSGNARVLQVTAGGAQSNLATGLSAPIGVAVDGKGNVYVAERDAQRVMVYPSGGGAAQTVASGLSNPLGIAVDSVGNLFIADSGRVVKVPPGGPASTYVGNLSSPQGVAVDASGNVYVAQYGAGSVLKVAPDLSTVQIPTPGRSANGVAVDSSGNLYMADIDNQQIVKLSPDGTFTVLYSGTSQIARQLNLDAAGNVYFTDTSAQRVVRIPADGSAASTVGSGLRFPSGVAVFAPPPTFIAGQDNPSTSTGTVGSTFPTFSYGANRPAGQVQPTFAVATGQLPPGLTLNLTTGALSGTFTMAGTYTFQVRVANASTWSLSAPKTIIVSPAPQTITFTANPGSPVVGGTYNVAATGGGSGNPVTFSTTSSTCSVSGITVRYVHTGSCAVSAAQAGNANYTAASATQTITVGKGSQTISVQLGGTTGLIGDDIPVDVTTGATDGAVVINVAPGTTTCAFGPGPAGTVTLLHAGSCVITADQLATSDYTAAPTATATITISRGPQAITITSPPPADAVVGGGYDLTAAGGASGNPVTFSTSSTTCTVGGSRVTFTAPGACVVAADQAGNTDYTAAPTVTQTVQVGAAGQVITFTTTPPTGAVVGDDYVPAATGGGSGNPVTFTLDDASTDGCILSGEDGGTVTVRFIHPGTCILAADQAGDANYTAAPTLTQTITVGEAPQQITFTSTPPAAPAVGDTYQVTATGGSSGNPVTFTTTSSACTVTGSTVTFSNAGTCTVAADQAENRDYTAAPTAMQTITVGQAAQIITITSVPPAITIVGGTYSLTAVGGASGNPISYAVSSNNGTGPAACTIRGDVVTFTALGDCAVTATQAGNADFTPAVPLTQTITIDTTVPAFPGGDQTLPDGTVGVPYSVDISSTAVPAPADTVTAGRVPPGLTLVGDPVLTGKPTTPGTYTFTLTATNRGGQATATFTVTIRPAPTATTPRATLASTGYALAAPLATSTALLLTGGALLLGTRRRRGQDPAA